MEQAMLIFTLMIKGQVMLNQEHMQQDADAKP